MLAICLPVLAICIAVLQFDETRIALTPLGALLSICAIIGARVSLDIEGTLFWDGSFLPLICAVALLGPLPAVVITVLSELAVWHHQRYGLPVLPLNLVGTVVPNLLGAFVMAEIRGFPDLTFYAVLACVVCGSIALNATLVTALAGVLYDVPILERLRRHRSIVTPVAVNVVLAMGAIAVYRAEGLPATGFVFAGVFVFAFVANRLATEREQRTQIQDLAQARGRLVAQVLEAEDRERRALADELHDDLVQTLLAAKQDLAEVTDDRYGDISVVREQIEDALVHARRLIRATHPSVLEQVGLGPAIRAIIERAANRGRLEIDLELEVEAVSPYERFVFSVVRELLSNVVKHAGASRVEVSATARNGEVRLLVRDDGVGFQLRPLPELARLGHIGLVSLIERVEALGGVLRVVNRQPGTDVRVVFPIVDEAAREPAATGRELTRVGEN